MIGNHWAVLGGAAAALLASVYVFWGPPLSRKRKGFPGLHNFGNSCFLNVILQSWAACPSLLKWLSAQCTAQHQVTSSLTAAVLKVLQVLNNLSEEPLTDIFSPGSVLAAMERRGWVMSPGQQDCHEMMHALSETLDEETSRYPSVLSLFDVKALQDSRNRYQCQTNARTRSSGLLPVLPGRQVSPLHGLLAFNAKCLTCGYKYPVKYELFDSLTLSLPHTHVWGGITIESLLRQYVHPEVIENAYCPGCVKMHESDKSKMSPSIQRTITIGRLPHCLCLHVQRLQICDVGLPVKRQDHVIFPEILAMDPYIYTSSKGFDLAHLRLFGGRAACDRNSRTSAPVNLLRALNYDASTSRNGLFLRPPSPLIVPMADVNHNGPSSTDVNFNELTSQVSSDYTYHLTAVISHLGDMSSGHFVSYRRGPPQKRQPTQLSDSWWYTSDCTVERVSFQQVLSCQAYMLFYERK